MPIKNKKASLLGENLTDNLMRIIFFALAAIAVYLLVKKITG